MGVFIDQFIPIKVCIKLPIEITKQQAKYEFLYVPNKIVS